MTRKFTFTILAMLFAILGPGAEAWGQTSTWDLTKSSTDWTATGNETYFSQPYGYKKANGTLTNKNVADFTTYATEGKTITSIKVGFKGLRNGNPASKITISLVDNDGNILTSGSELELTNASAANSTAYVYSTFTTGFTGATGFMMKVTTFGKNVLINGASYEIEYTEVGAPELESIAISGTPNKTTYEAGEEFDPAGLVVTGTYDDESQAEITSGITWEVTPSGALTAGTTSVSVTAKVGEVESPAYQVNGLTVNARTLYSFGFETATSLDWDFENMESMQTHSNVTAHSGSYFGTTGGKSTASMTTKSAVAKPGILTCYVSKQSTNTTSSTWKIQISSDNKSSWTDIKTQDATSMTVGTWVEFTADLSSYKNVYVRIYYTGSTAMRNIDDVSLTLAKDVQSISVLTAPTKTTYNVGDNFNPAGLVITATYDDESTEDIAYAGNESDFSFNPTLTTPLTTSNTSVNITYGGESCNQEITVTLNQLATPANLQATNVTLTSATLTWNEVANASSYEVNVIDGDSYDETFNPTTNSLLVEGLTASTTYTWTVKAKGDNTTYSDSDESVESSFTTPAIPTVAYTVTFDGNEHGTPASESITETEAGAGVTLPDCTPNAGYQFVGWATSETATEAEYEAGAIYYPTANITLYAVYNQVYTITWSVNGTPTTDGNPTTSVVEGEGITTLPTTPASISGMAFQGWTATQIAISSATAPTDLFTDAEHAPAITANTTFYAVFAEESEGDVTWNNVTTLAGITEGEYVLVSEKTENSFKYMPNTESSGSNPALGTGITINNNVLTNEIASNMPWSLVSTGTTNEYYIRPYGNDKIGLGTTNSTGANIRISSSCKDTKWTIATNETANWQIKNDNTTSMYLAVYSDDAWRNYSNATTNQNGKFYFFKKTQDITYTYYTNVVVKILTSISLSGEYPTEFWKGETFSHEGMTVTAHYENAEDEDVTEKAEFTGYDMATAGEQTVTVKYDTESKTYNITVKTIANTPGTAYTVAEAKELIDANPAELATTKVYVKGTISQVDSYNSTYHSITYWISEDGTTTNQFEVYSGKNLNNTDFASKDDVKVGDDVVVYGIIKKFNSTYEFDKNNYLVSHLKVSTLSIEDITVEIDGEINPEIETNVPAADYAISYSVASEDVVKVQDGNLVTVAVGGPVTVTATLTADGYKDAETTFTVEVIKALQSIAVKTAPTTLKYKAGDKFDPTGLVITATYSDASTGDIAYEENEDSFAFEPSLETALTTENTSVTITYAGKETTQTIEVRALYTYKITWKANGEQFATTEVTEGDALVLPETNPDNVGDMVFQGWINTENYYDAETAPEYIVPSEIIPTAAMTFYAVYAKETSEFQEKEVTYTFTSKSWGDATSSWTSGKDGNSYQNNQGVQVTYGVTGANATSKSEFTEVTKVVVNYCTNEKAGKGTIRVKVGDGTAQSYSVSAPSSGGTTLRNTDDMIFGNETGKVNITVECGTNSIYINSITITSKVGKETISNFCTTITALSGDLSVATTVANKVYYISAEAFVPANATVTINGALINTDHEKLIIEDGGQLIHHNAGVAATVKKSINGYTNAQGNDGYYLIANPTDNATVAHLTDNDYDLYTFDPEGDGEGNEWINKHSSPAVANGTGYLYASRGDVTLQFAGELLPAGSTDKSLTYAEEGTGIDFPGFNLIGNPFACNAYVMYNEAGLSTYRLNAGGSELVAVKPGTPIAPCEGFFVEAEEDDQTVVITTEESEVESSALSLTVSQNRGSVIDRAIVSFNGSANLHKFMLNPSHTNLSIAKDGETFAAVSSETKGELPVSFKAETTGTYTISVNTENVTAGYIHLIDNMTGTDVDLLATPSYTFIGSPRDNENRFTVKFEVSYGQDGDGDEHFAYQNGSELVVNGEGTLQIFDILGRVVISEEVHGQTVNVGGLNTGAYIVRLTGESVKTQKIVVR